MRFPFGCGDQPALVAVTTETVLGVATPVTFSGVPPPPGGGDVPVPPVDVLLFDPPQPANTPARTHAQVNPRNCLVIGCSPT
jgi:hypothetical protein